MVTTALNPHKTSKGKVTPLKCLHYHLISSLTKCSMPTPLNKSLFNPAKPHWTTSYSLFDITPNLSLTECKEQATSPSYPSLFSLQLFNLAKPHKATPNPTLIDCKEQAISSCYPSLLSLHKSLFNHAKPH